MYSRRWCWTTFSGRDRDDWRVLGKHGILCDDEWEKRRIMKRMMMQLFRSLVTIIVVGTMAVMIFSLRSELAEAKTRARAIEWFRKNHITKLWLESYRHGERVETKLLEEERDAFRAAGFEACGMITPTKLNDPPEGGDAPFGEKADRSHACAAAFSREVDGLAKLAEFLRGAERKGWEWWDRECSVSCHEFKKGNRLYVAFQNVSSVKKRIHSCPTQYFRPLLSLPDGSAFKSEMVQSSMSSVAYDIEPYGFLFVESEMGVL